MIDGTHSRTFAYDDLNRLITANTDASLWGTASFAYDTMGLGTPPIDASIPGRRLRTNTPANDVFYTFTDHLGTPLIQTDPTTAIVWRAEHEPYGNVYLMRKGARTDQPLRFPGQEAAGAR